MQGLVVRGESLQETVADEEDTRKMPIEEVVVMQKATKEEMAKNRTPLKTKNMRGHIRMPRANMVTALVKKT